MRQRDIVDMPVALIMQRWPTTVPVFLREELHCVGCPIGGFHTLADAAREHGASYEELERKVLEAVALNEEAAD